jgi:DNA helicase II / ATP-dependent DNA helicase PcrA
MANYLTLAVAGSRKTQGLVQHCASLPHSQRALVVTFTQTNQSELRARLSTYAGNHPGVQVMGWFTLLLRDFARPFLPFMFPGERIRGFNFEGRPHRMAKGLARFVDSHGAVYACELGRLASELIEASKGALLHRLECIYDEILIDEVQDLSSYDWEIIDALLKSSIDIRMVGDIRQAVLSTNHRSAKNKKYAYAEAIYWFREREALGILSIIDSVTTWRCHPKIAAFSDSIFDATWSFPATQSLNENVTGHDGVFLLHEGNLDAYLARFSPRCLRNGANSGKKFDLEYLNFGLAKGNAFERVLIVPTGPIIDFVQSGKQLEPKSAANFYVAVTRAEQSVAIVMQAPGASALPYWEP